MSLGKEIRLKRVIEPTYNTSIICALDHGMTSPIFLPELVDLEARTRETICGGANVIMMSAGLAKRVGHAFAPATSFAMLMSASATVTGELNRVVQIGDVARAASLGADAVVVYVALGSDNEPAMLRFVASIGETSDEFGIPFIAEAEFPTTYRPSKEMDDAFGLDYLLRNVRICAELGADIIKTNWPGEEAGFSRLIDAAGGIPVVLAGGSRLSDEALLQRMASARRAGAIGCSVGRNIFQHRRPTAMTRALCRVIQERWDVGTALEELAGAINEGESDAAQARA
jgi:DhnA family fructose-bisphosphate aldolase class Ia